LGLFSLVALWLSFIVSVSLLLLLLLVSRRRRVQYQKHL